MPEISEPVPAKFLATLVRGECHYLRDIRFDHGIPTVVMDYHKEHLEEHAVDVVHAAGFDPDYDDPAAKVETRAKFSFMPYAGDLDVGRTIGANALNDMLDNGAAIRMRNFADKEAARLAKAPAEVPKFDAEARRAEVERPAAQADGEEGETLSAPRPRPRSRPAATARTTTA